MLSFVTTKLTLRRSNIIGGFRQYLINLEVDLYFSVKLYFIIKYTLLKLNAYYNKVNFVLLLAKNLTKSTKNT